MGPEGRALLKQRRRIQQGATTTLPRLWLLAGGLTLNLLAAAAMAEAEETRDFGVLVMAHGGDEGWNESVLKAATTFADDYPFEVAFGMASAESLQAAIRELEAEGVRRIGVIRLFVSGESWLERTRQILGLSPGAPVREDIVPSETHHGHHDLEATFWRIDTESSFALSEEGLSEAPEMSEILVDRARSLSVDPERESVLLLAHGPADDEENQRWIENLERLAAPLVQAFPFRAVEVHTLREDWEDKREIAESRIRAFVERANGDQGRCLVIPFRVYGFGPYADVLGGLDYESDGRGLLPHLVVSEWMVQQAEGLSQAEFESTLGSGSVPPVSGR